ncbi:MAG: response regulator, partial [Planctomycetales bacterium]|nr:response regulator [Planctomycetales bacterium]NIP85020.1 response regulator [Planctomycetales bacterium]
MSARILIVDDERSMCQLLEADLRSREFDTTCSTSAEEAFAAVQNQPFDVVLTDLKMPGMDGIQLC